jgi:hypothetical protein
MENKAVNQAKMSPDTTSSAAKTVHRYGLAVVLMLGSLIAIPSLLHAQAMPTEHRTLDLQAGAGFSAARPDYGHGFWDGPSVFGTIGLPYHFAVEVDVHLINFHNYGTQQAEDTYEVGGRYNIQPRRLGNKIVIYPKFMYGRAVFDRVFLTGVPFNLAYNEYSIGGGVEYKAMRHITVRVGDFEAQRWLGFPLGSTLPQVSHGLTPYVLTTGAMYHF